MSLTNRFTRACVVLLRAKAMRKFAEILTDFIGKTFPDALTLKWKLSLSMILPSKNIVTHDLVVIGAADTVDATKKEPTWQTTDATIVPVFEGIDPKDESMVREFINCFDEAFREVGPEELVCADDHERDQYIAWLLYSVSRERHKNGLDGIICSCQYTPPGYKY